MANQQDIESGARQVEAAEHMSAGLTEPQKIGVDEGEVENGPVATRLGELTLSMFQQGSSVRVRVGDAAATSELYEHAFASAFEANTALLEAGVLTEEQVPDKNGLAGTGIHLAGVTAEQLQDAGLKQLRNSTL